MKKLFASVMAVILALSLAVGLSASVAAETVIVAVSTQDVEVSASSDGTLSYINVDINGNMSALGSAKTPFTISYYDKETDKYVTLMNFPIVEELDEIDWGDDLEADVSGLTAGTAYVVFPSKDYGYTQILLYVNKKLDLDAQSTLVVTVNRGAFQNDKGQPNDTLSETIDLNDWIYEDGTSEGTIFDKIQNGIDTAYNIVTAPADFIYGVLVAPAGIIHFVLTVINSFVSSLFYPVTAI